MDLKSQTVYNQLRSLVQYPIKNILMVRLKRKV